MTPKSDRMEDTEGVVTARTCDCCGHHEIGIVTPEGEYLPLKPGMRVVVASPTSSESEADS